MRHRAKKRFGQNFLHDDQIIFQIIQSINPGACDHLIEIGPGLGAITLPLLANVQKIDAIELDRDVIPRLIKKTADFSNLTIHQQDALLLDLQKLTDAKHSLRIVGNLPYNIATPLLFHLIDQKSFIIDMHFMLQKEVAERLAAQPGTKQYGRLSVIMQYHCDIELLINVPPYAFEPAPKVDSLFIRLLPRVPSVIATNLAQLEMLVKQAFAQRRKTLANNLKLMVDREQLLAWDIDPSQRPEDVPVADFVRLSNLL